MNFPDLPAVLDRRAPAAPKPLVYTFTILKAYRDNCPHQMYRRYIKKDLGKFVETEAIKFGNWAHDVMEKRVGQGKPLPEEAKEWESIAAPFDGLGAVTEQKLGLTKQALATGFWDDDVFIRGKLDLTLIKGDTAYLLDHKTGSSNYEDAFELEIGALLLGRKHQNVKKMVGQYAYLKEGRLSKMYDLSDIKATWVEANKIISMIEHDRMVGEFEKKVSGLCKRHCDVFDCEHNGRR